MNDGKRLQARHFKNVIISTLDKVWLVKLLHFTRFGQHTNETPDDNIFDHACVNLQCNYTTKANYPLQIDILLCNCNRASKPFLRLTSPENPISLEIRHVRQTEPQEPSAIYAVI